MQENNEEVHSVMYEFCSRWGNTTSYECLFSLTISLTANDFVHCNDGRLYLGVCKQAALPSLLVGAGTFWACALAFSAQLISLRRHRTLVAHSSGQDGTTQRLLLQSCIGFFCRNLTRSLARNQKVTLPSSVLFPFLEQRETWIFSMCDSSN